MKLIREAIKNVAPLFEEKNGKRHLYLEGVYLQGGIVNRNGRFYPPEVLSREVGRCHPAGWEASRRTRREAARSCRMIIA